MRKENPEWAAEIGGESSLSAFGQKISDYKQLAKFRLTATVVFTSVMAYIIAAPFGVNWMVALLLASGGFLVTAAANALNQVLEKDFDKLMTRTKNRPVAAGRMTVSEAVLSAGFMSLIGIILLALVNHWVAFLGTLSLVIYAFIYTPLKRVSTIAVAVGAVPGALPMLIGVAAAEGQITTFALMLFAIQFLWQFPHFWAIGWVGFDDYKKAGYKLIPAVNGERDPQIGWHSFIYAMFLALVCGSLPLLSLTGIGAGIFLVLLSLGYAYFGLNLYRNKDRKSAMQLMFSSFAYLPLVILILFLDKFLF